MMTTQGMTATAAAVFGALLLMAAKPVTAETIDLPAEFEQELVVAGLADPSTMAFSPDGRLFIAERVVGRLRVAVRNESTGVWTLNAEPFYTFDIPKDGGGQPEAHRSSGIRGFAFDPAFESNGYVYAFYMKDQPRHNRVVRIQADPGDPDVALPAETTLFEMPFNGTESSGSHNGGALIVGDDGYLYVSTGDGWNGGDNVQSLTTYTGKIFRIATDGTIPADNPFYDEASGDLRAVYALGLRNPYSMSKHPLSGVIYINDVAGNDKARILQLQPAANYGHDGYGGIGTDTDDWSNAGTGDWNGRVISGGAWYPACGVFPPSYFGSYFATLWGTNGFDAGEISRLDSEADPALSSFGTNIAHEDPLGSLKPVYPAIDGDGHLYYLMTNYEAQDGRVYRISPLSSEQSNCGVATVPATSLWGAVVMALMLVVVSTWLRRRMTGSAAA